MFKKTKKRLNKSEYDESSQGSPEHPDSDAESQASGISKKSRKLTAKRYWTRILSICYRSIDFENKYSIDDDLELEEINNADLEEEEFEFTPPIFAPSTFFDLTRPMEVESFKLSERELKTWGIKAT